ncbi:hypothetical protein G7046_g3770 [Stylonectria norvegica]|nr:hypothetical protein G7046_g3770 [Stylonectria norvegica]
MLNNGVEIPGLGFGTFANEGAKGETYNAVTCALQIGYRHLDCAWFYLNEGEVGDAVRDFIKNNPAVKRDDIFITTKVWNHLYKPEDVKWSLDSLLKNLGLDYIDLFLVHWPIAAEKDDARLLKLNADGQYIINKQLTENPEPMWRAIEDALSSGKTRAIGVSNWTIAGLKKMLQFANIKPQVNQIEVHPFLPNSELVQFCQDNDILPQAYSPLGSQDQVLSIGEKVRTNKTLLEVADRSGYTLAQVLLSWGLRRGYIVLLKSSTPLRIESNFQVPNILDEDFAAVEAVA